MAILSKIVFAVRIQVFFAFAQQKGLQHLC